ncbi:RHS repeat-associated core domain-containing protein, partial [Ralstonia nicotianae]
LKSGANVPTGATRYVYDGAGHLIGEYDQSGNAIQETVYLGDTPVATVKNGTPYYIYADQIDTLRVITDTNNLMVWRWDQADPFGVMLPDENPTSLGTFTYNLRFPGQVYDQETGKHYNVNRDYDPASGRYVQSDPIGLNGGQPSTFAYVGGQPTRYTDPKGLCIGPLAIVCVVLAEKGVEIAALAELGAVIATGTASPVSSAVSFPGRAAQELANDVYLGIRDGKIAYVGISNNVAARACQHGSRFDDVVKLTSSQVTRDQARAIEQTIINHNPQLENQINSIAPSRDWYEPALEWARNWMRGN